MRSSVRGFFFGKRESVFPRVTRSRAPADPDPVRTEIAAQLERLPQKPRPNCRVYGARDARHELVGAPRRRDSRLRSPKWDDANQGSDHFLFSLGFV